jgi:hypothetical protein
MDSKVISNIDKFQIYTSLLNQESHSQVPAVEQVPVLPSLVGPPSCSSRNGVSIPAGSSPCRYAPIHQAHHNNRENLYVPPNQIKTAIFTVSRCTYAWCMFYNIFLAFRYRYMRKNPATAPTAIPPVVAQNAHCSKNKLTVKRKGRNAISTNS